MVEYISPAGEINHEAVESLVEGVQAQIDPAASFLLDKTGQSLPSRANF